MEHRATPDFWQHYRDLPEAVQRVADKNFELLKADPHYPSLHFKKIGDELWSVRVGRSYRALATVEDGHYLWFWIGHHDEYDRLVG